MSRKEAILTLLSALQDSYCFPDWKENATLVLKAVGVTDEELAEAFREWR